jgi:hypothetical protein
LQLTVPVTIEIHHDVHHHDHEPASAAAMVVVIMHDDDGSARKRLPRWTGYDFKNQEMKEISSGESL